VKGSLTTRILAIATVNVLLLALAAAVFARWQLRQEFEGFLMAGAGERVQQLSRDLGTALESQPPSGREPALEQLSKRFGANFLLVLNDGTRVAGQAVTVPPDVRARLRGPGNGGPPVGGPGPGGRARGPGAANGPDPNADPAGAMAAGPQRPVFLVRAAQSPSYWIGVRMPIPEPGQPPLRGTLLIATDSFFTNPFFFQLGPWIGLLAATLLLSALCWLPWVRGVTRDIRQIEQATARVAGGRFDVQMDVRRGDEIGRLAGAVGDMALRLDELVRAQRRFLGDAAHELRSPLTRMQVAIDLLESETPPDLRGHVIDVREDIDEMRKLADAVLQLSRAELGGAALPPERQVLVDAVERAVRFERGHADVRIDVPADIAVHASPDHVSRALRNVIRNAVFYAADDGPIEIHGSVEQGRVVIDIADHGPGVPEEELTEIFTPFYRLDASRARHSGGTGLGLAIVRAAVEASGGHVTCRKREPHGLVVTLTLPLAARVDAHVAGR
jgi:two-component system, OmpR family, sensor histidine kinase CpxA